MIEGRKAWVTLITDKSYVPGCLVLLHSLRQHGTKYPLVVMVLPSGKEDDKRLPKEYRDALKQSGCILREVDPLVPASGGYKGADTRFVDTWIKLRAFGLSEYERVVLIDSDMMARRHMDELFDLPLKDGWIAACHTCACNPMRKPHYPSTWVPANCVYTYSILSESNSVTAFPHFRPLVESLPTFHSINSGLVVLLPGDEAHAKLVQALHNNPQAVNYTFPDQDFLADYFVGQIKFIGYEYNAVKPLRKSHPELWKDEDIRNVHYFYHIKPWNVPKGSSELEEQFHHTHNWWWDQWCRLKSDSADEPWWGLVAKLVTE